MHYADAVFTSFHRHHRSAHIHSRQRVQLHTITQRIVCAVASGTFYFIAQYHTHAAAAAHLTLFVRHTHLTSRAFSSSRLPSLHRHTLTLTHTGTSTIQLCHNQFVNTHTLMAARMSRTAELHRTQSISSCKLLYELPNETRMTTPDKTS